MRSTQRVQHFKYEPNEDFLQNLNEGDEQLVHNVFMLGTSKDKFEDQVYIEQPYLFKDCLQQQKIRQDQHQNQSQKVIFTIIIHHEIYPYEAPYITVSIKDHFPRVDDFRNYFYQIMQIERWWPLITLQEIIKQMPSFAYQLLKSIKMQQNCYGKFEYQTPFYKQDLTEISPHFFICKVKLKRCHKNSLNSYENSWVYFTYNEIVVFSQDGDSRFKVKEIFDIDNMSSISSQSKDNIYKITFNSAKYRALKIKIQTKEIDVTQLQRIKLFQTYYQLIVQPVKQQAQKLKAIDLCNQIIIQAYQLHQDYIVEWAKKKVVYISQGLKPEE